jgi:hypothetical protein
MPTGYILKAPPMVFRKWLSIATVLGQKD